MAGNVGVPTPWWQLPGGGTNNAAAAVSNLDASAPPGYQYDRVAMKYVPIVGSATDVLAQRARSQSIEDQLRNRLFGTSLDGGGGAGGDAMATFNYTPSSSGSAPGRETMQTPQQVSPIADVTDIAPPDTSVSQANIFARAKDQVGQQTSGGLSALRSALAARGLLGGGEEVKGTSNILTAGQGQLGDTSREQAIQEANRQNDFAKLGYEGAITQRGQNITQNEGAANRALDVAKTAYQGNVTQRAQDIGASDAASQRAFDTARTGFEGAVTQRGQTLNARTAANTATNALLARLY